MPGLDQRIVGEIDWASAATNIIADIKSDFIIAPYFDLIYREKSDKLIDQVRAKLRSGTYNSQLPLTMSVPKSGTLTRPGSILPPHDRLIYQALVQHILPTIEETMDRTRTFSHVPSTDDNTLFRPSHESWKNFQQHVQDICRDNDYVLRADIANYFETIPQHLLINSLDSSGCQHEVVVLLEELLLSFRQRSSQGIIQGLYPSDVLGNFHLSDFDAQCSLDGHSSARYVDDIYVGFSSRNEARQFLARVSEQLRRNGLAFSDSKTSILPSHDLIHEESEVDRMFEAARQEIEDATDSLVEGGYGFQGDWIHSDDLDEIDEEDYDLVAVRALLAHEPESQSQAEKIDRFCLPLLRGAGDDFAVDHALNGLCDRPHLTRLYFSYLNLFTVSDDDLRREIEAQIRNNDFFVDYQRMYYLAGILNCERVESETVRVAYEWLTSGRIGQETRAICAIFVAKFGNANFRRLVRQRYDSETPTVQAAILYSTQFYPTAEKASARKAWGGHSEVNALIASAI